MSRQREPIDLLIAKDKSHLTKEQIEQRRAQELHVPFKNVKAPAYLSKKQKAKFMKIAEKLLALGIMTELDVDCLAMYVLSHDLYLSYTKTMAQLAEKNDIAGLKTVQGMQDKAFRQAQMSARELGLTITARAKLVIPTFLDEDEEL